MNETYCLTCDKYVVECAHIKHIPAPPAPQESGDRRPYKVRGLEVHDAAGELVVGCRSRGETKWLADKLNRDHAEAFHEGVETGKFASQSAIDEVVKMRSKLIGDCVNELVIEKFNVLKLAILAIIKNDCNVNKPCAEIAREAFDSLRNTKGAKS